MDKACAHRSESNGGAISVFILWNGLAGVPSRSGSELLVIHLRHDFMCAGRSLRIDFRRAAGNSHLVAIGGLLVRRVRVRSCLVMQEMGGGTGGRRPDGETLATRRDEHKKRGDPVLSAGPPFFAMKGRAALKHAWRRPARVIAGGGPARQNT